MKKNLILIVSELLILNLIMGCAENMPVNHSPEIIRMGANPSTVATGGKAILYAEGRDADGDKLTYTWSVEKGTLSSNKGQRVTYTAGDTPGDYKATVEISDGKEKVMGCLEIRVFKKESPPSPNNPPTIKGISVGVDSSLRAQDEPDALVVLYSSIYVSASVEDVDGDPLTYEWSVSGSGWGNMISSSGSEVIYSPPTADGEYVINLYVNDGPGGNSVSSSRRVKVIWTNPDVNKLAFHRYSATSSDKDIFLMYPDGKHPINITDYPAENMYCTWSPDGERLAFCSTRDGHSDLYIIDLREMDERGLPQVKRLTYFKRKGNEILEPDWSPDGDKLAYYKYDDSDGRYDVFILDVSTGQDLLNLSRKLKVSAATDPAWSPEGRRIAFVLNRDGDRDIFIANADGTGDVQQLKADLGGDDIDPCWTSDGESIVFSNFGTSRAGIWRMSIDGKELQRLSDHPTDDDPNCSPDGKMITFNRKVGGTKGGEEILVMNIDGSGKQVLTSNNVADDNSVWSPHH